ncbi:MAG: hypothetical protein H8E15_03025 [Planctomycetes bacterium]|nr:hypothetical protein [Planctomycetota bacterium]
MRKADVEFHRATVSRRYSRQISPQKRTQTSDKGVANLQIPADIIPRRADDYVIKTITVDVAINVTSAIYGVGEWIIVVAAV